MQALFSKKYNGKHLLVVVEAQSHNHKSNCSIFALRESLTNKIFEGIKMSKPKARKKPAPYLYEGPPLTKQDKEEETDDIYDSEERETMLDDDEVTAAEEGFMNGREQEPPSKKQTQKNAVSHDDTIAVELAKEDSEDD